MIKKFTLIALISIITLLSCKKETKPVTTTPIYTPTSADSCGCEKHTYKGYGFLPSGGHAVTADTLIYRIAKKDSNSCKGVFITDTVKIYYLLRP
jgi:hypothetical protein